MTAEPHNLGELTIVAAGGVRVHISLAGNLFSLDAGQRAALVELVDMLKVLSRKYGDGGARDRSSGT